MKEKILEMLKMQELLDKSFMEYMGKDKLDVEKVRMALFDELGEVNHEMKAEWCYWKKTQKPVDREKLKEEMSDVYHFSLTLHRLYHGFEFDEGYIRYGEVIHGYDNWFNMIKAVIESSFATLYEVIILTEKLGFTFEEIYQAYIDKNKVNYQRIKEGY